MQFKNAFAMLLVSGTARQRVLAVFGKKGNASLWGLLAVLLLSDDLGEGR